VSTFEVPREAQNYIACSVVRASDRDGTALVSVDGTPLWTVVVVGLSAPDPSSNRPPMPEILRIQVPAPSEPPVSFGDRLTFSRLLVASWSARDGRSGLRYSADSVSAVPSRPQSPMPDAEAVAARDRSGAK
jgi:hypothetical protein